MAARGAKGDPELAALARERQDLVAEWQKRDALRNAALGQAAGQARRHKPRRRTMQGSPPSMRG